MAVLFSKEPLYVERAAAMGVERHLVSELPFARTEYWAARRKTFSKLLCLWILYEVFQGKKIWSWISGRRLLFRTKRDVFFFFFF